MNAVTTITGKHTTSCKLCKRAIAEAPALDIPVVGDPGKRAKDLQQVLLKHLFKHHPEEFSQGATMLDEVLSFLILSAFESGDPSIQPRIEAIRARLFLKVRKYTFADSMLDHIVAGFGLDPKDADNVTQALRAVRDACCEFGEYGQPAEPSPIVTA
jgi:hypothetical protein